MKTKEEIEKITKLVKQGDQVEISRKSGVHTSTISLYLNGKMPSMSEATEVRLLNAIADVVSERKEASKKANSRIESLINK